MIFVHAFNFQKTHNLTLPSWADNATVYERLRSLNDYQFTLMYDTTQMRRLKGGMHELCQDFS